MSFKKCVVQNCISTGSSLAVSYHKFPSRKEFREGWLRAIKSDVSPSLQPSTSHLICSRHFKKDDFKEIKDSNNKKMVLKQGVVPSMFPWSDGWCVEPVKLADEIVDTTTALPSPAASSSNVKAQRTTRSQRERRLTEADLEKQVVEKIEAIKAECAAHESLNTQETAKESATPESSDVPSKEDKEPDPKPDLPVQKAANVVPKKNKKNYRKNKYRTNSRGMKVKKSNRKALEIRRQKLQKKLVASASLSPSAQQSSNSTFSPGTKIEAQDFDGKWHEAKVVEVDSDEKEVLIHFDKNDKLTDEWIPMDSVRLRPIGPAKKTENFTVGEKCMARWNDSRKFPATVQKTISSDLYEVLFNDGYVKVVRGSCMTKVKQPAGYSPTKEPIAVTENSSMHQLNNIVIPDIPRDGEWCCYWINDSPVGTDSYLEFSHGLLNTIIVDDWRLPKNWAKHLYQRTGNYTGKWDTILVNPDGRKFRSRVELKQYLDETNQVYDVDVYDFCLHKKRAKEIGLLTYTDDYKKLSSAYASNSSSMLNSELTIAGMDGTKIAKTEVFVGALKVKIVNNLYMCPDCEKTFRKENHLQIHIKHYHKNIAELLGVCPNMQDLAYIRTAEFAETDAQPEVPLKMRKSFQSPQPSATQDATTSATRDTVKNEEPQKSKKLQDGSKNKSSKVKHERQLKEDNIAQNSSWQSLDSSITSNTSRKNRSKRDSVHIKDESEIHSVVKKLRTNDSINSSTVTDSDDTHFSYTDESFVHSYVAENTKNEYVNEYGEVIKVVRMRKEEIINCVCAYPDADGLMIQCELCLCWQHSICNGILKESEVPEKYVCLVCKNPERGRPSLRFFHDQDWLYDGKLYATQYRAPTAKLHDRYRILQDSHVLTGNLLELQQFLHSLTIKMNIASNKDHPKMYLWSYKWENSPMKMENLTPRNNSILAGLLISNGVKHDADKATTVKFEGESNDKYVPREEAIDPSKCQRVLLSHIQKQQSLALSRLQEIEAKINALDQIDQGKDISRNDHNGSREIECMTHRIMQDLNKMESLAEIFSSIPGNV